MRDVYGININSYVINIAHIDCDQDMYDILQSSIATPLNANEKNEE